MWIERDPRVPPHRRIDADGHPTVEEFEEAIRADEPSLSAMLENEADPTLENEATGSCLLVCRILGSDAGQGVDPAVA
jgi:hypothetical protein